MYILNKDKIAQIENLVLQGYGIRPICSMVGVAKQTVQGYRRRLLAKESTILCSCGRPIGHKGWCNSRIGISPGRQEWRRSVMTEYSLTILVLTPKHRKPRIPKEFQPAYLKWPYVLNGELPDYLEAINNIVPNGITEHTRAEICQELAMDYIAGEFTLQQLQFVYSDYIKKGYRKYSSFGRMSLDTPLFKGDDLRAKDLIRAKTDDPAEIVQVLIDGVV